MDANAHALACRVAFDRFGDLLGSPELEPWHRIIRFAWATPPFLLFLKGVLRIAVPGSVSRFALPSRTALLS
jgi:hypothetical protein